MRKLFLAVIIVLSALLTVLAAWWAEEYTGAALPWHAIFERRAVAPAGGDAAADEGEVSFGVAEITQTRASSSA